MSTRMTALGLGLAVTFGLSGCNDEQSQKQIESLRQRLSSLEVRLEAVEQQSVLAFEMQPIIITTEEKMFQPFLDVSTQIAAKGDSVPTRLYLDVELLIEVPKENFKTTVRQIFMVSDGICRVQLSQRLPVHGLKAADVQVSLRPLAWYQANVILSSDITLGE